MKAQDGLKMVPRGPRQTPRWSTNCPKKSCQIQRCPMRPNMAPNCPKMANDDLKKPGFPPGGARGPGRGVQRKADFRCLPVAPPQNGHPYCLIHGPPKMTPQIATHIAPNMAHPRSATVLCTRSVLYLGDADLSARIVTKLIRLGENIPRHLWQIPR